MALKLFAAILVSNAVVEFIRQRGETVRAKLEHKSQRAMKKLEFANQRAMKELAYANRRSMKELGNVNQRATKERTRRLKYSRRRDMNSA